MTLTYVQPDQLVVSVVIVALPNECTLIIRRLLVIAVNRVSVFSFPKCALSETEHEVKNDILNQKRKKKSNS